MDRKVIQDNRETLGDKVPLDLKDRLEIVVRLDLRVFRGHLVHLDCLDNQVELVIKVIQIHYNLISKPNISFTLNHNLIATYM